MIGSALARLALAGLMLAVMMHASPAAADTCAENRVDLRGPGGEARFTVEVAATPADRARGLMNRPRLGASRGMLFVYDQPQRVSFWMENTLIPLDMIFLGADGVVRRVHENARPLDRTGIPGGDDIQYVLEINGGLARRLGIAPGSALRHPSLDQDLAAWPCD
jgi:uncharacterized membrane protein (UPF0127 family)